LPLIKERLMPLLDRFALEVAMLRSRPQTAVAHGLAALGVILLLTSCASEPTVAVATTTSTPPAASPTVLAASPTVLAASPTVLAASPTVLAASPTVLAASPTVLAASPTVLAASPTVLASAPAPVVVGEQILFLRGGDLVAFTLGDGQTNTVATQVTDFAATPDGRRLALVRGAGEIWTLRRDTGELRQLTDNERVEGSPSWAPDGSALVYSAARSVRPAAPDWPSWSSWLDAAGNPAGGERTLGAGCEPSFGPDGRRIVYSAAPVLEPAQPGGVANALIMVNRQGANGWRVAFADGANGGQLVYSPAWSPDAGSVSYQRFVGYQALVDINLTEAGSSYQRNGAPVGWMLPPRFAPDGRLLAVTEHNASDARGFSGYDVWTTTVLRLGEPSQTFLPEGEIALGAVAVAQLPRAMGAAWSPDGAALVVLLPAGWQAGADPNEALFPTAGPGEIWRWRPGAEPESVGLADVDYGSPLLWLPAVALADR
jgi:hypothetical protein